MGDEIVAINDKKVGNLTLKDVTDLILGPTGSQVGTRTRCLSLHPPPPSSLLHFSLICASALSNTHAHNNPVSLSFNSLALSLAILFSLYIRVYLFFFLSLLFSHFFVLSLSTCLPLLPPSFAPYIRSASRYCEKMKTRTAKKSTTLALCFRLPQFVNLWIPTARKSPR